MENVRLVMSDLLYSSIWECVFVRVYIYIYIYIDRLIMLSLMQFLELGITLPIDQLGLFILSSK